METLIWSLFGQTTFEDLETETQVKNNLVLVLYYVFLILSVIMLVNMLVALLTKTYDNATVRHTAILWYRSYILYLK